MPQQSHNFTNQEIAQLFENVAAALTLKNGNRFKIIAYQNAAAAADQATSSIKDLWESEKLADIPGFGQTIQDHINELFSTGKVKHFDDIFEGINPATFEFLTLAGVGPKTAVQIADAGVKNIPDLVKKLSLGTLDSVISPKLKQKLQGSLTQHKVNAEKPTRMLLPYAAQVADQIVYYMKQCQDVEIIEPLGSLRRRVATIGDVDFAICTKNPVQVIRHFIAMPEIDHVVGQGDTKSSAILKIGVRVDIMTASPEIFGSLLQHFTGSKLHNIALRQYAKKQGLSVSEKGIKEVDKDTKFAFEPIVTAKTEEDFYDKLGMDWIPPELREGTSEIEVALRHEIPNLVELKDIKGDLHLHSSYNLEPSHDLGVDSMQDLAKRARELGYQYINLTDHNPALTTHSEKQIVEILEKRTKHIHELRKTSKIKLLNSLEIDILPSGELAVPKDGLKLLDLPICGVHSKHAMPRDEITKRLKTALENPYLKILVHPTNRLLNKRDESNIDWDVILDTAKKYDKVLEINSYPDRLDLPDLLVKEAISRGIKLVTSTDSHAVEQMDNMRYGSWVARRGWAAKADIVNTWDWLDFAKFFRIEY